MDASILAVFLFRNDSFNIRVDYGFDIGKLKNLIRGNWRELTHLSFELSCFIDGVKRVIQSDFDFQSICCFLVVKGVPTFEIHISTCESSSGLPNFQIDDVSSSVSSVVSFKNECDVVETLKSHGWRDIFQSVGQRFDGDAEDFRIALKKYSIENGFKFVYLKNDAKRITAKCVGNGDVECSWYIHAIKKYGVGNCFFIKKFVSSHLCEYGLRDLYKPPMSSKLIKSLIVDEVRAMPNILPKDIQSGLRRDYGVHINSYFAHKGKELARDLVFGDHKSSFGKLRWYVEALRRTNPGSHVVLEIDDENNKFSKLFVAFEACINGFQHLRPLICLDGTFLKGKFKGTLLTATCYDGNNGFFILCFGIVDVEDDKSWKWFLENLKNILPSNREVTFLSDRQHGLVSNILTVFPNSFHYYCLWHLKNNLRLALSKRARSEYVVELFEKCAYSSTHEQFQATYSDFMDAAGASVADFMNGIPLDHWVNAYFIGQKYGVMCSSIAESFNNWIGDICDMPITTLVDFLLVKIMKMMCNCKEVSLKWTSKLCPSVEDELLKTINVARCLRVYKSSEFVFEVHSDKSYLVDLQLKSCSCNMWRIKGLPCEHAVSCLLSSGLSIYDYYDEVWHASSYRNVYAHVIHPVPSEDLNVYLVDVPTILPPDHKKTAGRPRKNRIESSSSVNKKLRLCSKCNEFSFHNKRTCRQA